MAALPLGILKHMEKDGVLVVLHQLRPRCMDGRYLPHRVPPCGAVGGEERCGPQGRHLPMGGGADDGSEHSAVRAAARRMEARSSTACGR